MTNPHAKSKRLRSRPIQQSVNVDYENAHPFKSKTSHLSYNPPDYKLKPLQKLFRPYYSPKLGSYEVDVVFGSDPKYKNVYTIYLFCININTKYLYIYKLNSKKRRDIIEALQKLVSSTFVTNIRGDHDLAGIRLQDINFYTNSEANVQHNRIVDRVIRTIRDAVGSNYNDFNNEETVHKIVDIYNKT
jgi:hypothetical protein